MDLADESVTWRLTLAIFLACAMVYLVSCSYCNATYDAKNHVEQFIVPPSPPSSAVTKETKEDEPTASAFAPSLQQRLAADLVLTQSWTTRTPVRFTANGVSSFYQFLATDLQDVNHKYRINAGARADSIQGNP